MEIENPETMAFLEQLYTLTQGDPEQQASMYDIGENLGLAKNEAETLAQELLIRELAELKSLSGGIGITGQGLQAIGKPAAHGAELPYTLGSNAVLTHQDREAVEVLLEDVKQEVKGAPFSYEQMNALVIDIKTMEVQLLSERAGTRVVRELFRSLHAETKENCPVELTRRLAAMAGI
jgi:hypothetical protein